MKFILYQRSTFYLIAFLTVISSLEVHGHGSNQHSSTECQTGQAPQVKYFKFVIEYYSTMGPACKGCPQNVTSCDTSECVVADGYPRSIITVNRQMPGPAIHVCQGDTVVVDVENHLLGEDTSVHWHGLLQKGTPYMDGATFITQCPIPEGTVFRYKFVAEDFGTYFYHSHHGLQKMDGLAGLFVVRSAQDPSVSLYDTDEHVLFLQDWTHELTKGKIPGPITLSRRGQQARSLLINGRGDFTDENGNSSGTPLAELRVNSNARHRVRIVNSGCFECPLQVFVQNHEMTVIAVDGSPIKPVAVDSIIVLPGERVDVVLLANQPDAAYWIIVRALADCGDSKIYQRGLLVYEGATSSIPTLPDPGYEAYTTNMILNPMEAKCGPGEGGLCSFQLEAFNSNQNWSSTNTQTLIMPFNFYTYSHEEIFGLDKNGHKVFYIPADGENETDYELQAGQMNNISMMMPSSPPLSQPQILQQLLHEKSPHICKNITEHQNCFHYHHYPLDTLLDIIFIHDSVDEQGEAHPMHLHGYRFQVLYQGYDPNDCRSSITNFRPVLKDTLNVPGSGCARVRLYLDNPGFWLLHCHIIHHQLSGMSMLLHVGEESDLPSVPQYFPSCGNFLPDY